MESQQSEDLKGIKVTNKCMHMGQICNFEHFSKSTSNLQELLWKKMRIQRTQTIRNGNHKNKLHVES